MLLGLILLLIVLVPILPLPDPDATAPVDRLKPVLTAGHLLGTDQLGRDILSRLLWGTRVSIAVGFAATLIAAGIGSAIGIIAGYAGGRTDNAMMRGIDMLMAFPYVLLALAIVAALGPGLMNALYAIALVNIPFFARNVRGVTLGYAHSEFVDAARLSGKGHLSVILTEVLPNVMPVIVITMSTTAGWMILETAGLSFLGLGAQPPQADLGSMLGEGRAQLFTAPHVSVVPGTMIFLIVISLNVLGDGIRDVLDPRLRSGLSRGRGRSPKSPPTAPRRQTRLKVLAWRSRSWKRVFGGERRSCRRFGTSRCMWSRAMPRAYRRERLGQERHRPVRHGARRLAAGCDPQRCDLSRKRRCAFHA